MAVPCEYIGQAIVQGAMCETSPFVLIGLVVAVVLIPLMLLAFFYFLPGPGMINAFLLAKLRGSPLIFKFRKDKRVDVISGKYSAGSITTKQDGVYMSQPDSYYYLPNNMRMACVGEQYGTTVPLDVVMAIRDIKRAGFQTIDQVQEYISKIVSPDKWAKESNVSLSPDEDAALRRLVATGEGKYDAKSLQYIEYLKTKMGKHHDMFVPFDRVYNFFKFNINPSIMASTIEQQVAMKTQTSNKQMNFGPILWLFIIGMFALPIAYLIIANAGGGGGSLPTIQLPSLGTGLG